MYSHQSFFISIHLFLYSRKVLFFKQQSAIWGVIVNEIHNTLEHILYFFDKYLITCNQDA